MRLLRNLARRLDREHPCAAASVREGLEETVTVLTLGLAPRLQRSLATTNAAESLISRTRHVKRNVKRWRGGQIAALGRRRCARSVAATWRHPRVPEEHNTDHPHGRSQRHTGRAVRTGGQHRLRYQRRGDDHRINDGALRQVLAPAVAYGPPPLSASNSRRTSSSEMSADQPYAAATAASRALCASTSHCGRASERRPQDDPEGHVWIIFPTAVLPLHGGKIAPERPPRRGGRSATSPPPPGPRIDDSGGGRSGLFVWPRAWPRLVQKPQQPSGETWAFVATSAATSGRVICCSDLWPRTEGFKASRRSDRRSPSFQRGAVCDP